MQQSVTPADWMVVRHAEPGPEGQGDACIYVPPMDGRCVEMLLNLLGGAADGDGPARVQAPNGNLMS